MKRTFTSVCGGVLFPMLHYLIACGVGNLIHQRLGWQRLPRVLEFLLFFPVMWPDAIYNLLFTPEMFDYFSVTFLSLLVLGNFILYAFLTYRLLGRFAAFREQE